MLGCGDVKLRSRASWVQFSDLPVENAYGLKHIWAKLECVIRFLRVMNLVLETKRRFEVSSKWTKNCNRGSVQTNKEMRPILWSVPCCAKKHIKIFTVTCITSDYRRWWLRIWPLSDTVPLWSGSSYRAFVYIGNNCFCFAADCKHNNRKDKCSFLSVSK